jgi:hypothetical protein
MSIDLKDGIESLIQKFNEAKIATRQSEINNNILIENQVQAPSDVIENTNLESTGSIESLNSLNI